MLRARKGANNKKIYILLNNYVLGSCIEVVDMAPDTVAQQTVHNQAEKYQSVKVSLLLNISPKC